MEHLIMEKVVNKLNGYERRMYEKMGKFGAYLSAKYGISPSTAISVILGCVCLYMFVTRRWRKKQDQKPKSRPKILERSKSIARLYGGDLALRRLDDYNAAVAIPYTLERSDLVLKGLLEEEHLDLKKLQSVTARLEMAGKEEEGVRLLKEAKTKNAQMEKSHHVYEIDMLLAELLIYMGKHDEAKGCECLKQQKMMALDARRPLYKAIIYGMREEWGKAHSFWNKFVNLREEIMTMVGQEELSPEIKDFENFTERVKHLHKEIVDKRRSLARVYTGDVALKRLKDFNNNNKASTDTTQRLNLVLKDLLGEQRLDLNRLQSVIARMDMAGMGDEGVKLLSEAAKMRKAEASKSPDSYEIQMLLVEMLIYKGRPDEALQFECLKSPQKPLDARPPLFKAILYGMRNEWEKAERFWNEFVNVRSKSMPNVRGLEGLVDEITNFQMFKEKVNHLRNEITKKNP
ncbi:hypothetical protein QN277_005565 [Acacia crassicarpa]|uniref:Uncharacterized protein n=2 Tax=Acacia crassicarpa TaxID=499986 RepID=A0AAE1MGJ0_9FABA|nr:hypothetical protein QN277_005565 [Acacia crassicarpa]